MKKTWGKLFRRKSLADTELREDYPTTNSDSDVTDDERRQQEWQRHLNRRATVDDTAADELENDNEWEYESEYNVEFPSESSIIDAFKERKGSGGTKFYEDREFEEYKERTDRDGFRYENERNDRTENSRKYGLHPPDHERKRGKPNLARVSPDSPNVNDRVKDFERRVGKRRGSCIPPSKLSARNQVRRESNERYATVNDTKSKRRTRKQIKRRHRAHTFSPDTSDDEDKYTVKLTMEELNSIIQKNVNSAVKTIVSATTKGKKTLSPNESFSTETETIFSGSSSQSTEVPAGLLQKQIKAQLDKDMLKGIRKAIPNHSQDPHQVTGYDPQLSQIQGQTQSQIPSVIPNILEPCSYLNTIPQHHHQQQQQQHTPSSYFNHPVPNSQIPPAPPIPSAPPVPHVKFNLPKFSFDDMAMSQQNRRRSLIPGMFNFNDCVDMFGNSMNQAQLTAVNQDLGANPFNTASDLPPNVLNRLQNRRHTLATLGNEDFIDGLNTSLDSRFEQMNNALRLLDNNLVSTTGTKDSNQNNGSTSDKTTSADDTKPAPQPEVKTTDPVATQMVNLLAPVLSIADQIAAIKNKKKKPLKPGQLKMSGCVRGLLVLTNIVFLIAGAGILGLGIWMMMDPNIETYFNILNVTQDSQDFKVICYAMCAVGGIVAFIGFMGCCGGLKSNKCMLTMFIIMVAVITLAEVGLGVLVFVHQDSPSAIPILSALLSTIEANLKATLKRSVVEKYDPETIIGTTWNMVQISLECCGATGPDDYKFSAWKNDTTNDLTIPNTCCVLLDKKAAVPEPSNKLLCQVGTIGFFFDIGCFDMMVGWFKNNSTYILAAAFSILAVEIFSFIFALVILRQSCSDDVKHKDTPGLQ